MGRHAAPQTGGRLLAGQPASVSAGAESRERPAPLLDIPLSTAGLQIQVRPAVARNAVLGISAAEVPRYGTRPAGSRRYRRGPTDSVGVPQAPPAGHRSAGAAQQTEAPERTEKRRRYEDVRNLREGVPE